MNESDPLIEEPRLFDSLCSTLYLSIGFDQVKRNKGKPGIDGVSITDFEACLDEELGQLQQELTGWTYKPSPVRRVEIPKPGGKGVRLLGIPTVRDRVVQATLKMLLEPIFEPHFSPHSYGFRPGRSPHQAVQAAQQIVTSGKPYVVDIDLSKFFDRIHHDRLIARMGQKISDKRILDLIGLGHLAFLPIHLQFQLLFDELADLVHHPFRRFLRFHENVTVIRKPAELQAAFFQFLIQFLGFTVVNGTIAIAHKALLTAMGKVKELTLRGTHQTLDTSLVKINRWQSSH